MLSKSKKFADKQWKNTILNLVQSVPNVTFSKTPRIFVFHQGDKNSLDIDSVDLKDHPQFFVCKLELIFFRVSSVGKSIGSIEPSEILPNHAPD